VVLVRHTDDRAKAPNRAWIRAAPGCVVDRGVGRLSSWGLGFYSFIAARQSEPMRK
jgi:hypothetical protein